MIERKSEGSTNQDLVNVVLQHVQHMSKFAKMVRLPREFTPTSIRLHMTEISHSLCIGLIHKSPLGTFS